MMRRIMIRLVGVDEVEAAVDDLPLGSVLVVCDSDGERAAAVAQRVVGYRTAVFVGDLSVKADRDAACEFASETFAKDGTIVIAPQ